MMYNDFIEELTWRGMLYQHTPDSADYLQPGARGYIGFDPTADSLTIGNFVQVMILTLYQRCGHQPVVLLGGATGRIGDPSGKDAERQLKTTDEIDANVAEQEKLLRRLMRTEHEELHAPIFVNNLDWFGEMNMLDFLRDVGKTLTVNYMMSKECVKKRIETGISFTEFSYQLLQGYDFKVLHERHDCKLQMGGSDQWGNITTGIEFVRRHGRDQAHGITTPLLTKADGSKFGKSEAGAIWLSADRTSPYEFYQYWLNVDDRDLEKLVKYFSLKSREEMIALIDQIETSPNDVKQALADELTARVHCEESLSQVRQVSRLLFDRKLDADQLSKISPAVLDMLAREIPSFVNEIVASYDGAAEDLLTEECPIFSSKGEWRRAIKGNAVSINKVKVTDAQFSMEDVDRLHGRYILVENGKKNKYLLCAGEAFTSPQTHEERSQATPN